MRQLDNKTTGNSLTADEWNDPMAELQNLFEAFGIVATSADLDQVGKGIARYIANGNFYTDSGAANAYVLTTLGSKQAVGAYDDGMQISFYPSANNTIASTVDVDGLGVKNLRYSNGDVLASGELVTTRITRAIYNSSAGNFRLINQKSSTSRLGEVQLTSTPGSSESLAASQKLVENSGQVLIHVITSDDATWTPTTGVKTLKFEITGGGGGGGGADGQGPGEAASAAGGGGGGTCVVMTTTIDASYALTIGAGGNGGDFASSGNGQSGAISKIISSSFNISAPQGGGGGGMIADTTFVWETGGTGGLTPIETLGSVDYTIAGGDGGTGYVTAGLIQELGYGGSSSLCGSARGRVPDGNGDGAATFGGGGAGAVNGITVGTVTNYVGGDGFDGVIIITEYF